MTVTTRFLNDRYGVVITESAPSCLAGHADDDGWFHLCVRRDDPLRHVHVCSCGSVW